MKTFMTLLATLSFTSFAFTAPTTCVSESGPSLTVKGEEITLNGYSEEFDEIKFSIDNKDYNEGVSSFEGEATNLFFAGFGGILYSLELDHNTNTTEMQVTIVNALDGSKGAPNKIEFEKCVTALHD